MHPQGNERRNGASPEGYPGDAPNWNLETEGDLERPEEDEP